MGNYRKLTEQESAWASNLRRLYDTRKKENGLSQQKLADQIGMSQSAVTQYINSVIPLGLAAKVSFSIALKCDLSEIDPTLENFISTSPEEKRLVDTYRYGNQKSRELLMQVCEVSQHYSVNTEVKD